jgi:hypothetical protein
VKAEGIEEAWTCGFARFGRPSCLPEGAALWPSGALIPSGEVEGEFSEDVSGADADRSRASTVQPTDDAPVSLDPSSRPLSQQQPGAAGFASAHCDKAPP